MQNQMTNVPMNPAQMRGPNPMNQNQMMAGGQMQTAQLGNQMMTSTGQVMTSQQNVMTSQGQPIMTSGQGNQNFAPGMMTTGATMNPTSTMPTLASGMPPGGEYILPSRTRKLSVKIQTYPFVPCETTSLCTSKSS